MRLAKLAALAATLAVLVLLAVGGFGAQRWSNETDGNCERIHRVVEVGAEVIAGTREMVEQDYEDKLITRRQRDRQLDRINEQLERWNSADCEVKP